MFPYWLLFSIFAAGAVQYRADPNRQLQGGPIFLFAAVIVALVIGLRFEVGGDWKNYVEMFHAITDNGLNGAGAQEPGYTALNWLAGRAGLDIWAVNLACGAIFTFGVVKFARRQPNPWLLILVAVPYLIIVVAMGYTRQGVAIGLILAGLTEFGQRSIVRFVIYMILAAAFHKSAIIVAPLVALTATRNRWVTLGILIASGGLVYYAFVQASIDRMMTNYVEAEYSSQGAAIRVAMNLPPALLLLLFRRHFNLSPQESQIWRNFAIASFIALGLLIFTSSSTAVDRLALYLIPLQMFVLCRLPSTFGASRGASLAIVLLLVLYSATIQFVWLNFADNAWAWVPYKTVLLRGDTD